jgi:glutathione S-transferase
MSLTLYYHPLASYCWKALIALYELDIPFKPLLVDLGNEESRNAFYKVWPIGKFPVIRDEARNRTVGEASLLVEYLQLHFPGRGPRLIPADADEALAVRFQDRFFDLYVHEHMQKIVTDRLRPAGGRDAHGVEHARATLRRSYGLIESAMATQPWAAGSQFSLADIAACPALFYAGQVVPFGSEFPNVAAYLERLKQRPSFARVLREAEPYFWMVPKE